MRVQQYQIAGLGHLSTLIVDDATGAAAVVDPRRDVDVYLEAAERDGLRIEQVIETHLHNDYVSGGRDLAALTGATHVIGAGAELRYDARGVRGGDTHRGRRPAPDRAGHARPHARSVSYTLADTTRADEPLLMLTGGSLLVGAVGRTDLLGADNAPAFSAAMYRSLHDVILPHEDSVAVYPTHGAGSLCSTGIGSTTWSTIGYERRHDPLLAPMEVDAFARALLHGQPAFPRYFARMRPINQAGPRLLGGVLPVIPPMPVAAVVALVADGGLIVDARRPDAHAAGHIPGSSRSRSAARSGRGSAGSRTTIARSRSSSTTPRTSTSCSGRRTGSATSRSSASSTAGSRPGAPPASPIEAVRGHDGHGPRRPDSGPSPADRPFVIDVRQPAEYDAGHVPAAVHIGAGALADRLDELPRDRPDRRDLRLGLSRVGRRVDPAVGRIHAGRLGRGRLRCLG